MSHSEDLGTVAKNIINTNFYLTLATVDETGIPWATPVYYAVDNYKTFYWVSSPEVRHSHNISVRPQISMVIFDSQAAMGMGQGVYMSAVAEELSSDDLEQGITLLSNRSAAHGAPEWKVENVKPPTPYRLYRGTVTEHFVLEPNSRPNRRTRVIL
jgi:nitroimidazol reductase NimA-like FMN-containing flavoprotein (pyridoxamine 5'-phosphate oxidase superfamily)